MTPFGSLVDPDVYLENARSDGDTGEKDEGALFFLISTLSVKIQSS